MRKILFESEREQARQEAEEQIRQQQQLIASGIGAANAAYGGGGPTNMANPSAADIMQANLMNSMGYSSAAASSQGQQGGGGAPPSSFNPLLAMQSLNKGMNQGGSDQFTMNNNLMALLQGGNRFGTSNGAA